MRRFHKWDVTHAHPFHFDISSQRSSELFGHLTEAQKMKFFALQSKRRSEHEYLAYDTTPSSSYSQSLKQAQYGKNKEHDCLPQLTLLCSMVNHRNFLSITEIWLVTLRM